MEDRTVSEEKNKPVLSEQSLAKLLEAAFVLQEHNREMQELELRLDLKRDQVEAEERARGARTPIPESSTNAQTTPDYTQTLGKIVEIQHQIQIRRLELESALKLVAERVMEMGRAQGAAIGVMEGETVHYRGTAGRGAPIFGSKVAVDKTMFVPCLRTGQVLRCTDVTAEFLLDADECRRRGIQSLIAVPIFHEGGVTGGLELYYTYANGFTEQDVHTCQLMAGLITEALAREEEASWKKSLANERAALLDTLEKLQPNLAALLEKPAAKSVSAAEASAPTSRAYSCRKCGHQLTAEEHFCGQCGTPRASDYEPPNLQSKVASMWQMQELQEKEGQSTENRAKTPANSEGSRLDSLAVQSPKPEVPELFSATDLELPELHEPKEPPSIRHVEEASQVEEGESAPGVVEDAEQETGSSRALAKTNLTRPADWSSAASAREFLEQLAGSKPQNLLVRLWNTRRGDIYLAIAVILVACVIRWGILSDHSVKTTGAATSAAAPRKAAPDGGLSLLDRMLIQLGLAEAPETPEDRGSPGVQVWVDLHTALYYCPGADLYGKTPKGKFTTQREAQLDQFEPAYRKACN